MKGDYTSLLDKFNLSREKYKRAALLLTDYLDDLLNTTPNLLSHEQDMHLNLDKMHAYSLFNPFSLSFHSKETPIEELGNTDKIALLLVLLKQLQPYLSEYTPRIGDSVEKGESSAFKAKESHAADTLNRILNNINVQTKRSEVGSRENLARDDSTKLPRMKFSRLIVCSDWKEEFRSSLILRRFLIVLLNRCALPQHK